MLLLQINALICIKLQQQVLQKITKNLFLHTSIVFLDKAELIYVNYPQKTVSFYFRSVSGRPGSIWAASLMLLERPLSSCGTRRSRCCPRRAPLDRALKVWRRPSMPWPPWRTASKPTLSSFKTGQLPAHVYALKRWSSSRKLFWASSWSGDPHSRHRATSKRRVWAGEDSQITGSNVGLKRAKKKPPHPYIQKIFPEHY